MSNLAGNNDHLKNFFSIGSTAVGSLGTDIVLVRRLKDGRDLMHVR